jgi:hypothetical protein
VGSLVVVLLDMSEYFGTGPLWTWVKMMNFLKIYKNSYARPLSIADPEYGVHD